MWSRWRRKSARSSPPELPASTPRILVTGATGFIGQRLLSSLLEAGLDVLATVRPEKYPDTRLPANCEQLAVHLSNAEALGKALTGVSAVVYCAGSVRGAGPEDFSEANVKGVSAMLDALASADNSPPLLLISSLAASRPDISDYAASKYAGEQLLSGKPQMAWTIIRPPAVYGPGDREMLPLFKMIRRGLLTRVGPGKQRVSLLHVDDLVSAILLWLSAPDMHTGQTYAIDDGTSNGYGWDDIGKAVNPGSVWSLKVPTVALDVTARVNLFFSSLLGYTPMLTPGKVRELIQPEWLCDNRPFTDATGWKPRIDLAQGARQLFSSKD